MVNLYGDTQLTEANDSAFVEVNHHAVASLTIRQERTPSPSNFLIYFPVLPPPCCI